MSAEAPKNRYWRNIASSVVGAVVFASLYVLPAEGALSTAPSIRLVLLPMLIGIALALALSAPSTEKIVYIFAVPVIPLLYFGLAFSGGTDAEGRAFAWMLVGLPLLPYLICAGATTALLALYGRGAPRNIGAEK